MNVKVEKALVTIRMVVKGNRPFSIAKDDSVMIRMHLLICFAS